MTARLALSAAALLALSVLAFWPRYLSRLGTADFSTHLHAVLGTLWLLLLVAQPLLVRSRRLREHRAIGRAGCVVGAVFVLVGILLAHRATVAMDDHEFERWRYSMYLPLSMTVIFAAALALGVRWRSTAVSWHAP